MHLFLVCVALPAAVGFCGGYFFVAAVAVVLYTIAALVAGAGVVGIGMALASPARNSGPLGLAILSAMVAVGGVMLALGTLVGTLAS